MAWKLLGVDLDASKSFRLATMGTILLTMSVASYASELMVMARPQGKRPLSAHRFERMHAAGHANYRWQGTSIVRCAGTIVSPETRCQCQCHSCSLTSHVPSCSADT